MKQIKQIRHRRLNAFYTSKTLNSLMIVLVDVFCLWYCIGTEFTPLIAALLITTFALIISYSCWLWFCKPAKIVINESLSDMSALMFFYFLVVSVMKSANQWWYIFPIVASIVILFIQQIRPKDELFEITEAHENA